MPPVDPSGPARASGARRGPARVSRVVEAQDVVQQTWLGLHMTDAEIESLPAWLTTVATRLCLHRLRSRTPVSVAGVEPGETA